MTRGRLQAYSEPLLAKSRDLCPWL